MISCNCHKTLHELAQGTINNSYFIFEKISTVTQWEMVEPGIEPEQFDFRANLMVEIMTVIF